MLKIVDIWTFISMITTTPEKSKKSISFLAIKLSMKKVL